jgi:hypothetical protein
MIALVELNYINEMKLFCQLILAYFAKNAQKEHPYALHSSPFLLIQYRCVASQVLYAVVQLSLASLFFSCSNANRLSSRAIFAIFNV